MGAPVIGAPQKVVAEFPLVNLSYIIGTLSDRCIPSPMIPPVTPEP
jgi:hypothetical protein